MPPGSLDNFEEAVTKAKNGFITWESIDRSWKSYEFALKKVVELVFYGSKATRAELGGFYDQIDAINQVMRYIGAPVEFTNVKQLYRIDTASL